MLQIRAPTGEKFTQILSVGIGGSALGPQFVAEALAPDNPPLKVSDYLSAKLASLISSSRIFSSLSMLAYCSPFRVYRPFLVNFFSLLKL